MKTLPIKNAIFAVAALAGMQLTASCDSCSRKEDTTSTNNAPVATHDTVYIDTCMAVNDSLMREGATGNYIRVNRVSTQGNAAGNGNSSGSKATTGSTGGKELSQEEIDARVENSSSQAYKNGRPVSSGGTSGTGQGTGTGSTGNNSRVTTKADQQRN